MFDTEFDKNKERRLVWGLKSSQCLMVELEANYKWSNRKASKETFINIKFDLHWKHVTLKGDKETNSKKCKHLRNCEKKILNLQNSQSSENIYQRHKKVTIVAWNR